MGRSLNAMLAQRIGADILRGLYPCGTALPTELETAHRWKISRSAYREAIRILSAKGMVETRTKAGTLVTTRSRWNVLDPEVLGWMRETEPSGPFIQALFELRSVTEPAVAVFAAQRRTDAHLRTLAQALDDMAEASLAPEAVLTFHQTLLAAAGNEALQALTSSIGAAVTWSARYRQGVDAEARNPVPGHWAVFDAVRRQDVADARRFMDRLVRQARHESQGLR